MDGTASDYFGALVAQYDSLIRRAVPRYEEMTDRLVEYLPGLKEGAHVLELGCGTGNLTLRLVERYPGSSMVVVDAAPEMVEVTASRAGGRVEGRVGTFEEVALEPGRYSLITSCISLHHVEDKRGLYQRLLEALSPGGHLVFADQLRGGTERLHRINWERWLEFCRSGDTCTDEEIQGLLDHAEAHDHYTPLVEHFRLLEAAGFGELDCVWRNWIWGVLSARKR